MHNLHSSSDDDENDLKEFSFPQEAVLQQVGVFIARPFGGNDSVSRILPICCYELSQG